MKTQNDKVSEEVRELVYSDYNNKYEQLKSELNEKEKGCKKRITYQDISTKCGEEIGDIGITFKVYCPTCQAKIEYLKKGISACEEILSQQNKTSKRTNDKISSVQTPLDEFINKLKEEIKDLIEVFDYERFISIGINKKGQLDDKDMLFTDEGIRRFKQQIDRIFILAVRDSCMNTVNERIKQALSQRNQEILEIIDEVHNREFNPENTKKYREFTGTNWSDGYYKGVNSAFAQIKQQLTNSEGKA